MNKKKKKNDLKKANVSFFYEMKMADGKEIRGDFLFNGRE